MCPMSFFPDFQVLNDVLVNFAKATHEIHELDNPSLTGKDSSPVVLHGYLGTRADLSKHLSFVPLLSRSLDWSVQIVSSRPKDAGDLSSAHRKLRTLKTHTPVVVHGQLKPRSSAAKDGSSNHENKNVEVELLHIQCLNEFPRHLIRSLDDNFGPEDRHLQLRTGKSLRDALHFRAKVARLSREELEKHDFLEVETPLLFKSTPEGAREFVVPTRRKGLAYALPQSPQQFKQILMGSGISRYYQMARCFRDEDHRADRQPEFTQLDLEMSFASGSDVMERVTTLIKRLWKDLLDTELPFPFQTITYRQAMLRYGSDKPDLRYSNPIRRVDDILSPDLTSKLTNLENPAIEALVINLSPPQRSVAEAELPATATRKFIYSFLESPQAAPYTFNPHGHPGVFVYDFRAPIRGLSAFGFERAASIEDRLHLEDGALIILQARPDKPWSGGSIPLGALRSLLLKEAFKQGLLVPEAPYAPLWVTDFPLFTPTDHNPDEGQSSPTGLSSTHHPFTSPKSAADVRLLANSPEEALADHYDLVINGVELGGGSRRIHDAAFQTYILKEVLKLSDASMEDFSHLIKVLKAGCPPHAGFALGFDRLVAMMLGKESVKDVIAFPKGSGGDDKCVGSPARLRPEELKRYGLQMKG